MVFTQLYQRYIVLHLEYPEVFAEATQISQGIFASFPRGRPILVIKISAQAIAAARLRKLVQFYLAPVTISGVATYCLLSTYQDDIGSPLMMFTPLFSSEHSGNLIRLLSMQHVTVYFLDEKNRPWLSFWGKNPSFRRFKSFAQKMSLLPEASSLVDCNSIIQQASAWFSLSSYEDDRRAFKLKLDKALFGEELAIFDMRDHATGYHGAAARATELHYLDPGRRQEPDIAEQFARIFPPNRVLLNPLKLPNKEELCDILVLGEFCNIYVQLKSSPNTEDILSRTLSRKRAKTVQHLEKAVEQSAQCLDYVQAVEQPSFCLKADHRVTGSFRHSGKNAIFLIASQELFDVDSDIYSEKVLGFAEKHRKVVGYLSEPVLYEYLHYAKDETDLFRLFVDDFSRLSVSRRLAKSTAVLPRLLRLREADFGALLPKRSK